MPRLTPRRFSDGLWHSVLTVLSAVVVDFLLVGMAIATAGWCVPPCLVAPWRTAMAAACGDGGTRCARVLQAADPRIKLSDCGACRGCQGAEALAGFLE